MRPQARRSRSQTPAEQPGQPEASTGNKARRIVVPDATPNEFGDTQYHIGDAVAYDVTLAANPDDKINGGTSREYIAPIAGDKK